METDIKIEWISDLFIITVLINKYQIINSNAIDGHALDGVEAIFYR